MTATAPTRMMPDQGQMEILGTAAQCFMERGFDKTSIDDVARKLGSTKGRIYHFFASKADLFFAVAEVGMNLNNAAIAPCLKLEVSAIERLRAMVFAHCLSMIESQPYQNAIWQGVEIHLHGATTPEQRERLAALIDLREKYSNQFRVVMEQAKQDGDIDYPDVSIARQLMFSSLSSVIFWYKPRSGETAKDRLKVAHQCVRFALQGLGDRGEPTSERGDISKRQPQTG